MPLPAILAAAAPFVLKGIDMIGNQIGANQQAAHNMELAKYQNAYNQRMVRQQRRYDLPINQRKRLEAAGLNPNLLYGDSGAGMSSARAMPAADVQPADFQAIYAGLGSELAKARLMMSQADLTDKRVEESGAKKDLAQAQTNLVKSNPYMRPEYVDAMVLQLQSTATLKEQEMQFMTSTEKYQGITTRGYQKMTLQIEELANRLGLQNADAKLKAEILRSKELENALKDIQRKWLEDGDITPQHIYQGIMLLLSKMM